MKIFWIEEALIFQQHIIFCMFSRSTFVCSLVYVCNSVSLFYFLHAYIGSASFVPILVAKILACAEILAWSSVKSSNFVWFYFFSPESVILLPRWILDQAKDQNRFSCTLAASSLNTEESPPATQGSLRSCRLLPCFDLMTAVPRKSKRQYFPILSCHHKKQLLYVNEFLPVSVTIWRGARSSCEFQPNIGFGATLESLITIEANEFLP